MRYSDGYIYIIREKETDYYKIGFTQDSDATKRMLNLQTGNSTVLELIGTFYIYSFKTEHELHKYFSEQHIHGEWYKLSHEDVQNILSEEWRKKHKFYTKDEELIYNTMLKKYQKLQIELEEFMDDIRVFFKLIHKEEK